MQFKWQGKTYMYDPVSIDVKTAIAIKLYTGLGLKSWNDAVEDMDPKAVQCLLFAVKAQNGEPCEIAGLEFSIVEFIQAFTLARLEEMKAAIAAAEAEDADGTDPPVAVDAASATADRPVSTPT